MQKFIDDIIDFKQEMGLKMKTTELKGLSQTYETDQLYGGTFNASDSVSGAAGIARNFTAMANKMAAAGCESRSHVSGLRVTFRSLLRP